MEQISKIEINNFKSIRHVEIDNCRRLNVFIGYPNVGKSNILEALGLFCVTGIGQQYFKFNDICRVKHISELFFNQDSKEGCEVMLNDSIRSVLSIDRNGILNIDIDILSTDPIPVEKWSTTMGLTVGNDFTLHVRNNDNRKENRQLADQISKYEFNKDSSINTVTSTALSVPFGSNLLDVLQRDSSLRKEVVTIFKQYGLKLVINRKDESIEFQKDLNDGSVVSIPYHQVADTLRRLIFYKAAVVTNTDSVLLFEEPEAHMFPPYISKLASDIVFDNNRNQYFISTHSPFVLNDFMEELKDDELSIYAVSLEDGETKVQRLTDQQVTEIYQHGIDLFFNLENFLKND